jgi:GNAT superfamily N-acetyltransferase
MAMAATYFKRFRMEIDLRGLPDEGPLPGEYSLVPWDPLLLREHARVKWECFRTEMDSVVFPCLGDKDGCIQLMRDITQRSQFIPEATWLAVHQSSESRRSSVGIGTIQGMFSGPAVGSIQNLGLVPEHRGQGIGSALLLRALHGFWNVGCERVHLEVTASNTGALRLYQQFGFQRVETLYRIANTVQSEDEAASFR